MRNLGAGIFFIVVGIIFLKSYKYMGQRECEFFHNRGLFEFVGEETFQKNAFTVAGAALVIGLLFLIGALWEMLSAWE